MKFSLAVRCMQILISVHGNGLTNALWMNPGPHSGVFEFQPNWCRFVSMVHSQ